MTKRKRIKKYRAMAASLLIVASSVFGITVWQSVVASVRSPDAIEDISMAPKRAALAATSTQPTRLIIPAIGVHAKVQPVGISKRGTMAVPVSYVDVGWYRYGTVPGHAGAAVIAGHLDNGLGLGAVFKRLEELTIGDEVHVLDAAGNTLTFRVTGSERISAAAKSTDSIFAASSNTAQLNLITCEGVWIPSKKMYSERLVVFTELVRP